MPERLPALRPKEVAAALGRPGFVLLRQTGSHAHFRKGTLTLAMHAKNLGRGTLASILRQARMKPAEFKKRF